MKISRLFILCALVLASCAPSAPGPKLAVDATTMDFNWNWNFTLGSMEDKNYEVEVDDSAWRGVKIPHDWSIEEGYRQEHTAGSNGFLPGGIGWYRKSFEVPKQWRGKEIIVRFEAVYNNSTVWINGHELGFYPNGYLDFEYNLTPYLKSGENVIAVRVDRRAYADARWYVGGGIYRNVHLSAHEKIHIPTTGIAVTTPKVSDMSAEVNASVEVANDSTEAAELTLKQQVLFGGESVASGEKSVSVAAGALAVVENQITIPSPKLWSIEEPSMYELKSELYEGSRLVETKMTSFGVRTLEYNPAKGFFLNGKYTRFKGVNIHHDLGCVGVAAYDAVLHRRLRKLQEMGVNAVRVAHNPQSESFYAMCDTMGLLVMDEFVDEWLKAKGKWIVQRSMSNIADSLQMGYSAHFAEWAEKDVKHMVRRNRNHPSIIMWSIGNEIEWTYNYYYRSATKPKGYGGLIYVGEVEKDNTQVKKRFAEYSGGHDPLAETAHDLVKWVKAADLSRPVTSGVVIPSVSRISGYTEALDIVGYNYKDWHYESDHEIYPDQLIFGSENVGQYFEWRAVMDKPYIPGIFVWTGIDYLGENGPWPMKGGDYSFFDFACFKTPRGHFFECLWSDTPKTHIVTTPKDQSEFKIGKDGSSYTIEYRKDPLRRWEWFDTFDKWKYTDGEPIVVQVYTNASEVELLLNGKSLGKKKRADFAEDNIILWQVPYAAGKLTAVGLEGGKEVSRYTLSTTGDVAEIFAKGDRCVIKSDGYDVTNIEVSLLDEKGRLVVDSDEEISIEIDENLQIIGVDNGNKRFVGSHKTNTILSDGGRALVVLQPKYGMSGASAVKFTTKSGKSFVLPVSYKE